MKRWMLAFLAAVLCLSGCNVQKIEKGEEAPKETGAAVETPALPRKDITGAIIETGYADGVLVEVKGGSLHLEKDGKVQMFVLTKRAETDLQTLEIKIGDRMIVNFEPMEDGRQMAVSLEKIIEE